MTPKDRIVLLLAHGFGFGKAPFAPGTFGTIPGLLLLLLCLLPGSLAAYLGLTVGFIFLSVYICGDAEKILKAKDPGSIVFDEMIAIPIAFLPWIISINNGHFPTIGYFFSGNRWITVILLLILFRIFDIAKPWPVKQSQKAPSGWGVTIDDVLAAIYTGIAGELLMRLIPSIPR